MYVFIWKEFSSSPNEIFTNQSPRGCTELDIWSLFCSLPVRTVVLSPSLKSTHTVWGDARGTCKSAVFGCVCLSVLSSPFLISKSSSKPLEVLPKELLGDPFQRTMDWIFLALCWFFVWGEIAIISQSIQKVSNGWRTIDWIGRIYPWAFPSFFFGISFSSLSWNEKKKKKPCDILQTSLKSNNRWSHHLPVTDLPIYLIWWLSLNTHFPACLWSNDPLRQCSEHEILIVLFIMLIQLQYNDILYNTL